MWNIGKGHDKELPLFKYHHKFSILYLNPNKNKIEQREETWAVVNGLFRGKDNSLINQAIEVLKITPNPRKVLPWAGVAVALNKDNRPIRKKYQWFTFLPLPIESSYPIQFMDGLILNPKKNQKFTHDGDWERIKRLLYLGIKNF